jgi:hypothetical protein
VNQQPELLTPSAAARVLGVSSAWVSRLFDRGVLEGVRDSDGRRLLLPESVQRLADQRRGQPRGAVKNPPGPVSTGYRASIGGAMNSIDHSRKILLQSADGRPAGVVKILNGQRVLYKRVDPVVHQLRQPPAWAQDEIALQTAESLKAETVIFESKHDGRRWIAPLRSFRLHGFELDRGAGPQVALPLAHWRTEDKSGQMNLPFTAGNGSKP